MTVRTPILKYLRNGISLGFDGRQVAKGIVDSCSDSFCESAIALDETLLNQIGTRHKMSIEYQLSDDKSALLVFDLDQVVPALRSAALISEPVTWASGNDAKNDGKSEPVRLVLERRKFEQVIASSKSTEAWKAPLQKCAEVPSTKVVFMNKDLTLQNEREFREWTSKSSKCNADAVAWIKADTGVSQTNGALDSGRVASWTLYNYISKVMAAGVVPEDGSRVAIVPGTTIVGMDPQTELGVQYKSVSGTLNARKRLQGKFAIH
jgi:hypothetical protein